MKSNFGLYTEWLLVHEGGYVNHPKDPGGATNKGVTQRVYDAYLRRKGLPVKSVRQISREEVLEIYKTQYWNTISGDLLPDGLDYAVYDFAVNSGPSRAIRFLQKILRVKQDGVVGNMTLEAIRGHNNLVDLIQQLCIDRWNWMKTLKTFSTFGKGWTRRVMGDVPGAQPSTDHGVIDRATKLAQHMIVDVPRETFAGKADEEDQRVIPATVEAAKKDDNLISVTIGAVPGTMAAMAALPEGPIQWALAAILLIAATMAALLVWRKFQK